MEEIREIALAYYCNLSEDEKREANQIFRRFDSNGDGTITIGEFAGGSDPKASTRSLFRELDTNGDGKLNFEEFITFFYMYKSRRSVGCDGTGCNVTLIKGGYFTCVECFNHNKITTYDLCVSCYRYKNYVHTHSTFLDSHCLLRSMAEYSHAQAQPIPSDQHSEDDTSDDDISGSKTDAALAVVDGLNVAINIGQVAFGVASTAGCSIM